MDDIMDVFSKLDWSPLFISLKTAIVTTAICFILGVLLAKKVMSAEKKIRVLVDSICTIPIVLPPTVIGFLLLVLFSKRRLFGLFLYHKLGIQVIQSWSGCVIAAAVIAFPLMYRNARASFELVDENLIHAARTLGMNEGKIFFKIILPCACPGILSGTVLTFARALGEYGATSMLAGNIPGKTGTISQEIAMVTQNQEYFLTGVWVVILLIISVVFIVVLNIFSYRRTTMRRW